MDTLKIEASYRSDMSKSHIKEIRRQGFVTGSVFGHDSEPVAVEVKLGELAEQLKKSEGGAKSLIDIKIKGAPAKSDGLVIIKQFTKDPLTRKVLDIQFQRVSRKEKVHLGIPIVMVGEAPGIKMGGMVEQVMDELQISCLPTDIPAKIEVDISGLEIGHHISAGDVQVGDNIEILADPNAMVINCLAPHVRAGEAEEAPAEAAAGTEGTPAAE